MSEPIDGDRYHGHGGVMRPITPDAPVGVCPECGHTYRLRERDGALVIHLRERRPRDPMWCNIWCEGGMPAGAR